MPPRSVPPKAVLWDVDGTLVESTRLGFEGTNTVLKKNGYPDISEAQYKEGTKWPTPERMGFHVSGDPADAAGPGLARQFDELYVAQVSPQIVPIYAGLPELLGDLRAAGCRFGAVSNACGAYVRAVVKAHSWESDFECQLGADEVPAGKPAPDGLLKCCSSMGIAPEDCVYIGDSPTDGMAASAAGMRGIGVSWGANNASKLAEAFPEVVADVQALRATLLPGKEDAA